MIFSKGKWDHIWLKTLYWLLITLRINSNSLSCLISHNSPFHSSFSSSYFCAGPLYFIVPLHETLSISLHGWPLIITEVSSQMSLPQRQFLWLLIILTTSHCHITLFYFPHSIYHCSNILFCLLSICLLLIRIKAPWELHCLVAHFCFQERSTGLPKIYYWIKDEWRTSSQGIENCV